MVLELIYLLFKKNKIITKLFTSGLVSLVVTGSLIGYGYYNLHNVSSTDVTIESNKIDDLSFVQISDTHISNFLTINDLSKYCDEISELNADYIFLTGDIFEEATTYEDLQAGSEILGNIKNKQGIYFVFGNHDTQPYTDDKKFTKEQIVEELTKNNIVVLDDQAINLDNISIIGRSDPGFYNDTPRKSTEELMNDVNIDNYIIVLDHQPLDLETNASLSVDLQLSGHTHGGQIFPMGIFQSMTGELVYGQRTINDFNAFTSSGMSGWGYPIKTGAKSEYVIVNIK